MIYLKKISKKYGSHEVLKAIDFKFEQGKTYGIVGENGAGKTTLFRCLAGLESFDGKIDSPFGILKNHIGFLETNPYFLSRLTGKEHLQLYCNARNIRMGNPEELNIFNLPLNQYATTYSTGMKKKLAITALLYQKNELVILDEPFNGVDIQSNMMVLEILQKWKKLGKTIIISSHIFSTLEDSCDEIHLLKQGKFVGKYEKHEFKKLDEKMREVMVGDRLKNLQL
jgi:ABC-2 type transport system ATP-binding protein